jgi:hypothetical protein
VDKKYKAMPKKIKFKDRKDLIDQLIIKKKDIPEASKVIDDLAKSLERYQRGDREAMQHVIKVRKKIFNTNAELYIELDETGMHDMTVATLDVLNLIDETNED